MALATLYAGFDTMGMTLTAVLYHIAGTPGCQTQLHAELDAALANGRISMPPTVEELKQLPYLEACLAETLRVHPTTGTTLPRTVPKGGAEIDGFFLPQGVSCGFLRLESPLFLVFNNSCPHHSRHANILLVANRLPSAYPRGCSTATGPYSGRTQTRSGLNVG
jgi:hypothetical protein